MLDGRLKETQFPWPSESEPEKALQPTGSRFYETDEVNYINGGFQRSYIFYDSVQFKKQNLHVHCRIP